MSLEAHEANSQHQGGHDLASQSQSPVDVVGAIHVRIIDQSLPPDGGPGLLKIDTHDDHEIPLVLCNAPGTH